VLYEGKPVGTPDCTAFWKTAVKYGVEAMFTAPTALRAIKREDPDLSQAKAVLKDGCLERLFVAGERCDPSTVQFYSEALQIPVIDNYWQTETGWPIAGNLTGMGLIRGKPGSCSLPNMGYKVSVKDPEGNTLPPNTNGALVVELPLPPGCFGSLYQNKERFKSSYMDRFPGYYEAGDSGMIDEDGYISVMARTDEVINVAGHRLSTGALEEVVLREVPGVVECAVVGVADELKGQLPVGFVVLSAAGDTDAAPSQAVQAIRDKIGPVAACKQVVVVNALPKTRSGKILRGTMTKIANGEDYKVPGTIESMDVIDTITEAINSLGYPREEGK